MLTLKSAEIARIQNSSRLIRQGGAKAASHFNRPEIWGTAITWRLPSIAAEYRPMIFMGPLYTTEKPAKHFNYILPPSLPCS